MNSEEESEDKNIEDPSMMVIIEHESGSEQPKHYMDPPSAPNEENTYSFKLP
jgi:hypothetical protein